MTSTPRLSGIHRVAFYSPSTHEGGEGLWWSIEDARAHAESIRAQYPDAEIEYHPNGQRGGPIDPKAANLYASLWGDGQDGNSGTPAAHGAPQTGAPSTGPAQAAPTPASDLTPDY